MQMSEAEICKRFKEAKDHRKQVGILADLNCCSRDQIREILLKNGIAPPRYGNRYTKIKEEDLPKNIPVPKSVFNIIKDKIDNIDMEIQNLEVRIEYLREVKKELNDFLKGCDWHGEAEDNDSDQE